MVSDPNRKFEDILSRKKEGSLQIYLGYAAGVGKTYAMLREGHRLKELGFDVIIGYVEPHHRQDTTEQIGDLEIVPPKIYKVGSRDVLELDTEAVIARQAEIVLVDELAHTNAKGSRYEKRFLDVFEILASGINVITTLNVQHLESIADKVASHLGIPVAERIPDAILNRADQIVNIDIPISELRDRLRLGKVYTRQKAETALRHFFTSDNLAILRNISLQEAASDQKRRIEEQRLNQVLGGLESDEAIMVAMSSDPTYAEVLIRKAAKMAAQLSSRCYVIYIERPHEAPEKINPKIQRKLIKNLELAKLAGAEVVTLKADDIAAALVDFAHQHNVRHAIFGKSRHSPLRERIQGSIVLDFIHDSVAIDVHIVSGVTSRRESL